MIVENTTVVFRMGSLDITGFDGLYPYRYVGDINGFVERLFM